MCGHMDKNVDVDTRMDLIMTMSVEMNMHIVFSAGHRTVLNANSFADMPLTGAQMADGT